MDQEDALLGDIDRLDQWTVAGLPLRWARSPNRPLALARAGAWERPAGSISDCGGYVYVMRVTRCDRDNFIDSSGHQPLVAFRVTANADQHKATRQRNLLCDHWGLRQAMREHDARQREPRIDGIGRQQRSENPVSIACPPPGPSEHKHKHDQRDNRDQDRVEDDQPEIKWKGHDSLRDCERSPIRPIRS